MKEQFVAYIKDLQDTITSKIEAIDGGATFKQDLWERPQGGGGRTRVIENGYLHCRVDLPLCGLGIGVATVPCALMTLLRWCRVLRGQ